MKKRLGKFMIPLCLIIFAQPAAFCSEEGVLNLSRFALMSEGIGNSGPVNVTGTIDDTPAVASLTIEAFGKEYVFPQEELTKIPPGFYNGIQISYEAGYKQLGGRTVYIILQSGFVSGITTRVRIALAENGDMRVEGIDAGRK